MEEKKSIKISLGTTVCIFIIILLVVSLGVVYYLGFIRNKEESKDIATNIIQENNTKENVISIQNQSNENEKTDNFIEGKYFIQPDKSLLDDAYFDTSYVDDENINFKNDGSFNAYIGWGMGISGTYNLENNIINCVASEFNADNTPEQKINISISFNIINDSMIEILNAPSTFKIKVVDTVNNTLTNEEKELSLDPFVKGIKLKKANSHEYTELNNSLGANELFSLILLDKNSDGTYTLYGGIYNKKDSTSAEFSYTYKKVIVSENTKYIDYYGKETTIKEIYDNSKVKGQKNELSLTIYANSANLLEFEFSNSKCTLIKEINLST